jgi:M6 family metalloprotease-like protein
MRKVIALVSSLLLVVTFATPAQSAGAKYSVYQKTLATFSSSATTLTTQQKAQVKATVEANPAAEKFICTGIRYYDQPMSVNITVRKRAKAACEYAKQLNPFLSTWFQNKPTQARSYAGKVLLTVKSSTFDRSGLPRQNEPCTAGAPQVVGIAADGVLRVLSCGEGQWRRQFGADPVDQLTGQIIKTPGSLSTASYLYKNPEQIVKSPSQAASIFGSAEPCKIPDAGRDGVPMSNPQKHFVLGFDIYPERANLETNAKFQLLPIDFSDAPGSAAPGVEWRKYMDETVAFFNRTAGYETDMEFIVPDEYIRMDRTLASYNLVGNIGTKGWEVSNYFDLLREVLRKADSQIDFSNVAGVALVPAFDTPRTLFDGLIAQAEEPIYLQFPTNEGPILNVLVSPGGGDIFEETYWGWVHEMGHLLGLTDVRDVTDPTRQDSSYLGIYELMNAPIAPELLSWQRWLLGVLDDDQVDCYSGIDEGVSWLRPVASRSDKTKMAVMPISKYKALVVESRRNTGYDTQLAPKSEGLIAYVVDTTIPYTKSGMWLVPAPDSKDAVWRRDAALASGQRITYGGWTVEVLESGEFGELVSIRREE